MSMDVKGIADEVHVRKGQGSVSVRKGMKNKRWRPIESRFFIRFMASQVEKGLKGNKSFKRHAIFAATRALKEEFGKEVSEANVHNHLRTIRRRWARIKHLKELSGVEWDTNTKTILMGYEYYKIYIKAHSQDEPYINKPIEDYDSLEAICGNDQVAGHLTRQLGDPIGVDIEDNDDSNATPRNNGIDDMDSEDPSVSSSSSPPHFSETEHSQSQTSTHPKRRKSGGKRKHNAYVDALREVAASIRELASALKSNRSISFASELAKECMKFKTYGYTNREIARAYDYLMANDSKALAFFGKNGELRKLWVEDFLGLPKTRT